MLEWFLMAKDPKISAEDSQLFRDSVGAVRRFKDDKVATRPFRPVHLRRHPAVDEYEPDPFYDAISDGYQPADVDHNGPTVEFVRAGIQQGVLRKLRRGQFNAEVELDLHGLTVAEARNALIHFLQRCREGGVRHVRIIHGQGNSSRQGRPVLKGKVALWLQQLDDVLAFTTARPEHGGAGALYLLLKRHQK